MRKSIRRAVRAFRKVIGTDRDTLRALRTLDGDSTTSKVGQLLLIQRYQELHRNGLPLPSFEDVEFRAFSQNGEDGILLYLFSLLGMTNRLAVEICAGDGIQCNTANLIINHGWHALLIDGDEHNIARGSAFYGSHPDTCGFPPSLVRAWITRDNVNQLISEKHFGAEIDLLSLDLDGVDYWIWEALDVVRPRVVVAEIQCIWGPDVSVTVPYSPDFRTQYVNGFGIYSGASLAAFAKLAARKGYRLVGLQKLGFNAFFVRNDLGLEILPAIEVANALDKPFVRWAQAAFLPLVKDKEWQAV